jgi:protein tyrosine/serine phosphatase
MSGWAAPSPAQIRRVLALLTPDDAGTTFVHCRRGKDRTGTVIACYRIQHDGWSNREAQLEANRYGMSWAERAMRSFIEGFRAMDLPVANLPEN